MKNLAALSTCDAAKSGEPTCAGKLIDGIGRKLFRRPVSAEERASLMELFSKTRGGGDDYATSVATVLEAMLQSPMFLFRTELGPNDTSSAARTRLTQFELAAQMSYALWASAPDDDLLDAARDGKLEETAQLEAQARRMLADPRGRRSVSHFVLQWMGVTTPGALDKSTTAFPEASDQLRASMLEEAGGSSITSCGKARRRWSHCSRWAAMTRARGPPPGSISRVLKTRVGSNSSNPKIAKTGPFTRG